MSKFIELTDWRGKFKRLVNVDNIKYISEECNPVQVIVSVYSIDECDIEHEGGFGCKESYDEVKEMILNG